MSTFSKASNFIFKDFAELYVIILPNFSTQLLRQNFYLGARIFVYLWILKLFMESIKIIQTTDRNEFFLINYCFWILNQLEKN